MAAGTGIAQGEVSLIPPPGPDRRADDRGAVRAPAPHHAGGLRTRGRPEAGRLPAEAGLRLEITDDGAGFELADVNGGGYGLRTMRERAAELRGQLNVRSAPGAGTTVRLDFPAPLPTVATNIPS